MHFGFDECDFSSSISILDYDSVLIYTGFLFEKYIEKPNYNCTSKEIYAGYERVREQLIDFLQNGKNVFVIIGQSENDMFPNDTSFKEKLDRYSFLPTKISLTHVSGSEINYLDSAPESYKTFFKKTGKDSKYEAYFKGFQAFDDALILAKIKNSNKSISAQITYSNGKIIFLPQPCIKNSLKKPPNGLHM